ncbi:helix-turn-helix domain-containing protein [Sulfurimonas microaerophilic]|uniref:helix-turn-helix domain-containing protein n=1 Tax=Sulfurimonas microaerophilic TaxID=3058392 RepID=UPI0027150452|nr:helix-turn-helix transcriptional regulator [Sulfurimonas sp. hsl 1-7]
MPQKITDTSLIAFHKQIGFNVKKAREEKGITQLELSQRLGYTSVSVVSKAEKCIENKHFSLEQLYRIANELKIDLCSLIKS